MANFYLDISAVGNEYQAYADTPATWGVPQDANGKASNAAAAAVAVATINCSGASASGTGTIGVLGVTVSSTLNASGSALAAAIVTAINASTTAVSTTYCRGALPLNRLVFARQNPGDTTQVQIMLRIAGADWNTIAPTQANITGATVGAFSGGVDGPFGYMVASSAVFGKAAFAYGFFVLAGSGSTAPGLSDLVIARTKRSGANLTLSLSSATAIALVAIDEFNIVFDNGTDWSGDNGRFTLSLNNTSGSVASSIKAKNGAWNQKRYLRFIARAVDGFCVSYAAATSGSTLTIGCAAEGSNILFKRVRFEDSVANGRIYAFTSGGSNGSACVASECNFYFKSDHAATIIASNVYSTKLKFIACYWNYSSVSADPTSLVAITGAPSAANEIEIRHCKAEVSGGAWKVANVVSGVNLVTSLLRVVCDDVGGVRVASFPWAASLSNSTATTPSIHSAYWQSRDGDQPFRFSTPFFTTDWIDDGTYPTAGETLPSGNEWSMRSVWTTGVHVDDAITVATVYSFFRGTQGVKTLTIDLLVPNTGAPTSDDIEIVFSYTDKDGVARNETSNASFEKSLTATGVALSSSAKSWTLNGLTGYAAKKIEITTTFEVGSNTEISAAVCLYGAPSVDTPFFINPAVGVS